MKDTEIETIKKELIDTMLSVGLDPVPYSIAIKITAETLLEREKAYKEYIKNGSRQTTEQHAKFVKESTDSQNELMRSISGGLDYERTQNYDIPDGTITTQPYFSDLLIAVALK